MRALTVFFALLATVAGAYAGFAVMRAVGPGDRSNDFGYGAAAQAPPDGGTLLQSRNFARVVEALERELGADARIQNLDLELLEANATATVGDRLVRVEIDASGRSQQRDIGEATPTAGIAPSKLDADAIDKMTTAARKETGSPVNNLSLQGGTREWQVYMLRGEPDRLIANLDGGGLRLSGEPNPEPVGAGPDSMLRAKNLQRVLDAAANEGNRVIDLSIWPERVNVVLEKGGREVSLDYGYDAQLTNRDVRARSGARQEMPVGRRSRQMMERKRSSFASASTE